MKCLCECFRKESSKAIDYQMTKSDLYLEENEKYVHRECRGSLEERMMENGGGFARSFTIKCP